MPKQLWREEPDPRKRMEGFYRIPDEQLKAPTGHDLSAELLAANEEMDRKFGYVPGKLKLDGEMYSGTTSDRRYWVEVPRKVYEKFADELGRFDADDFESIEKLRGHAIVRERQ